MELDKHTMIATVLRRGAFYLVDLDASAHADKRIQAMVEIAAWLARFGVRAFALGEVIHTPAGALQWRGGLWALDGSVGLRAVTKRLMAPEPAADSLTPYQWPNGRHLTRAELRAWLKQ